MYIRGRKKADAEPAPPARDPRDVEMIERLHRRIQELELQQLQPDSPAEEEETKPNVWDDEPVDVNPFGQKNIGILGLKIEIPEFTCKVHPDDCIDWLSTVERVFDVRDILDKLKVKLVAIKLRQHASLWWDHIKAKSKGSTSRFTPPTRTTPPTAPKAITPTTSAASNTRERVDNAPHCYKCGGLGHYARDCSNLKTLAFVSDDAGPIYDTDAEPEVDKPGDELVYHDRKEALVIQRVLNVAVSKSVDDNSWLRNNIFRTKCTSKGKFYDMIIDGGSCENIVSTYMIERLGMKTKDHPKPYQLTWLKKGNIVKVSKRCLVQFSIGKSNKDEVWCEVIPMDAAHILLGRPWQFDRKTKHDGFQNTYSFKKDGVNITLVPFDSRQTQAEGSNFFYEEDWEFAEVIPDDIPPGLPAMREIQHCIDFIPVAITFDSVRIDDYSTSTAPVIRVQTTSPNILKVQQHPQQHIDGGGANIRLHLAGLSPALTTNGDSLNTSTCDVNVDKNVSDRLRDTIGLWFWRHRSRTRLLLLRFEEKNGSEGLNKSLNVKDTELGLEVHMSILYEEQPWHVVRISNQKKAKSKLLEGEKLHVHIDRDDHIRSLGLKIEIPEFTCKVHPDDFIDWSSTVERVFNVRDIPDKLKVKLVAIKLRQHASLWWEHVNKRRRIKGKSKVETWAKTKKLMKAKFLQENHRQEAFLDYQNLTMEEVINELDTLRMRCDVVEEEKQVVARFLGVLKPEILILVPLVVSPHLPEPLPLQHLKPPPSQPRLQVIPPKNVLTMPLIVPSGGLGHYARDCPNLKTLAFVPDDAGPIYDTDAEPEVDEPGDELTQAEGSNLFMKKTGFEKLMITSPYVFTFVAVEENEIISEAPLQVHPLLREFADVIPDDIPPGLPAMRDIQRCVDFILGSAIPNKPSYRMNPNEFAELQS
uniref:CCHC-type domain-containing protein n=1 Tax=Tanacetum cinerariifolium TaxID=118510 RepID=A0A6L2KUG5_TANCI|nr:hypothetical protein [Tanacetum cinerariifolium]